MNTVICGICEVSTPFIPSGVVCDFYIFYFIYLFFFFEILNRRISLFLLKINIMDLDSRSINKRNCPE